jgi:hypothetical protein
MYVCMYVKEERIDLFNYYNHKENCQYTLSLFLFFSSSPMYMYMCNEAVAAIEYDSVMMMMMIEQ